MAWCSSKTCGYGASHRSYQTPHIQYRGISSRIVRRKRTAPSSRNTTMRTTAETGRSPALRRAPPILATPWLSRLHPSSKLRCNARQAFETPSDGGTAYRPTHGPEPLVTRTGRGLFGVRVHMADQGEMPSIPYRQCLAEFRGVSTGRCGYVLCITEMYV